MAAGPETDAVVAGMACKPARMPIEIRVTTPDEYRAAADVFRGALLSPPSTDDDWAKPSIVDSWSDGHSVSAWEGARCVGHASAFHFTTVVPGGATVPTAAITRIGVRQTHTRQGVLTRAMHRLLHDAVAQGKVLASLRASEAVIYGRFGFAVAGETWSIEIDRLRGVRVTAPTAAGSIRLLERDEVLGTIGEIHDLVGLDRPGAIKRPTWMHQRYLEDVLSGEKAAYAIVHTAPDGTDDGWAQYSLEWPETFAEHSGGVCEVADVWGADSSVELALWKFILELDLVERVRAEERPGDDAVRFALNDQRHYLSRCRNDEQWLRLLDVDAALVARTYNAAATPVTIAITDPMFERNNGTWHVGAGGARRVAGAAADDADLATDINGISAAYMGGTAWHDLLVGGHVQQRRAGAVAAADLLFASRPLPRCGSFF